jgi:sRNA-binding regulator protein Hfq
MYPRPQYPRKKRPQRRPQQPLGGSEPNPILSETEASYFRSLVESRMKVTVVTIDGERLHGRIRYYDQDCFSVGLSNENRKVFLRKENVSYIAEE